MSRYDPIRRKMTDMRALERRGEEGLCLVCGKRPSSASYVTCDECRAKLRVRKRDRYRRKLGKKVRTRSCSSCGERDHNRLTCPSRVRVGG